MPVTFLVVSYAERLAVKTLGARWDTIERKWYVPEGRDLSPFSAWLTSRPSTQADLTADLGTASTAVAVSSSKGIPLSNLLAGVASAVATAYRTGIWTMVEVVNATVRGGHVYLEVTERSPGGEVLAKARAMIWSRVADVILPQFQQATGMTIAPGIKLLVRAKPGFHAQHGFGLEIDALDPDYTLGDLEAKKREIRSRLHAEGLFDKNRQLPAPWDYTAVLVIAPEQAAGLGDFQAEARRLSNAGVCEFIYRTSRFQGEGAAAEICDVAQSAVKACQQTGQSLDAIALIRGGGAVNDLAWLNDYQLARFICEAGVPVLTGIGHERDSTVLDEVAHTAFDTPSKVIHGIEGVIRARASEAEYAFENIASAVRGRIATISSNVDKLHTDIQTGVRRDIARSRTLTSRALVDVRHWAYQSVHMASGDTGDRMARIKEQAWEQLAEVKRDVPLLLTRVQSLAEGMIATSRSQSDSAVLTVLERSELALNHARETSLQGLNGVVYGAHQSVARSKADAESLMREIAGQGPDQTLVRGFAVVRGDDGKAVTSASRAAEARALTVQFHDGSVRARPEHEEG